MKEFVIISLLAVVIISGCAQESVEDNSGFSPEIVNEEENIEENIEPPESFNYNAETKDEEEGCGCEGEDENEIEGAKPADGNDILRSACLSAEGDYPDWSKEAGALVFWENSDRTFRAREGPEGASIGMDSPAGSSETIADLEIIGPATIGYILKTDFGWKVNARGFRQGFMNVPETGTIYEAREDKAIIDISFISESDFLMLYEEGENLILERIGGGGENKIAELQFSDSSSRIAASPKGNYVYVHSEDSIRIFDIGSKTQIGSIEGVDSEVWLGENHILYSDSSGGVFIYDVSGQNKNTIEGLPSDVSDIFFAPMSGGVMAFNTPDSLKIVECQSDFYPTTRSGESAFALADDRTAISTIEGPGGYWRFKDADWTVELFDGLASFNGKEMLATVWSGY